MEREILELTQKQCRNILYENYYNDGESDIRFITIEDTLEEQGRWSTSHSLVVQRESDGKFFSAYYSEGSTESQCHDAFEYDECKFTEVFPIKVEVIQYK